MQAYTTCRQHFCCSHNKKKKTIIIKNLKYKSRPLIFSWTRLRVLHSIWSNAPAQWVREIFASLELKWNDGNFWWWIEIVTVKIASKNLTNKKKCECVRLFMYVTFNECVCVCVWIRYFYDSRKKDGQWKNKWIHLLWQYEENENTWAEYIHTALVAVHWALLFYFSRNET